LKKLCQLSNAVYAISATPDAEMNALLKTFDKSYNDRYILEESAKEAISKNEIIPPHLEIMKVPEEEISVERLFKVLENSKKILPDIKHKILVTARSRGQLDDIYKGIKALNNPDIEVFAICSADETDKYTDYFVSDIREFSNKVENCNKDCFVIHVQMLI
jgi:bifunctional ADP-heptose synthase (sugar kinase/adenylyltransferase)